METVATASILVVDDEPSVLDTITAILQREGYEVVAVSGAVDALGCFHDRPFDVVLTDLRLEGASGLFVIGEMRRRWPHTTAVVLTGYASLQSAIDALREGAYDYLIKPCDVEELKATVARAVERGAMARQLRERLEDLDAANAKLQSFNDELQRRVAEATAELNEKIRDLAEAKRRLEEAHRQREEFISMIAHELGQPLTMIGGYAQLLGRANTPGEAQERARAAIVSQTRRLARLVKDLADASHLAAGHFQVDLVDCDLVDLIEEQTELARANTEKHTIRVELPGVPVPALVDRDRLAQVLSNLVTNAVKHTPGGEILIHLWTAECRAFIRVSDQGTGIPLDRLETVFEPHVQLGVRPGDEAAGAGLGLYISRGIVEAHGGRLWAESPEGEGARFTMWIPIPAGV